MRTSSRIALSLLCCSWLLIGAKIVGLRVYWREAPCLNGRRAASGRSLRSRTASHGPFKPLHVHDASPEGEQSTVQYVDSVSINVCVPIVNSSCIFYCYSIPVLFWCALFGTAVPPGDADARYAPGHGPGRTSHASQIYAPPERPPPDATSSGHGNDGDQ